MIDTQFKLNIELKSKWIEGLRSGKYIQGMNGLHVGETFCPLGVLVDLMGVVWKKSFGIHYEYEDEYDKLPHYCSVSDSVLPINIQEKIMVMNDVKNESFKEVANWIELNL